MYRTLSTIAIFALLLLAAPVSAQQLSPQLINFQGKLTDTNQAPVDGTVDIAFSIYDADTDGALLWSEDHTGVNVVDGIFNVSIGDGTPDPENTGDISTVLTGEDIWLEVQVGADPPMTPRQQITSVAYSIHSSSAVNAEDVLNKDINPNSVTIPAFGQVIDSNGQWVGDPTGLIGPQGPAGPQGTGFGDSPLKVCQLDNHSSGVQHTDLVFPYSWTDNTCRSWACAAGWKNYGVAVLYSNGTFSINTSGSCY